MALGTKRIISIDVRDQKVRATIAAFEAFHKTISEMPEETKNAFAPMNKAARDLADALKGFFEPGEVEKQKEAASGVEKIWLTAARHWTSMRQSAAAVRKEADRIGQVMTRGGVGTAFGSIFGLGGLAAMMAAFFESAQGGANKLSQAQRLGLPPGVLMSIKAAMAPYGIEPTAMMQHLQQLQANVGHAVLFSQVGIGNAYNESLSAAYLQEIEQIRERMKQYRGLPMHALMQKPRLAPFVGPFGVSLGEMYQIGNMPHAQFQAMKKRLEAALKPFPGLTHALTMWQRLDAQIEATSTSIEKHFLRDLAPIAPELNKIVSLFGEATDKFLNFVGKGAKKHPLGTVVSTAIGTVAGGYVGWTAGAALGALTGPAAPVMVPLLGAAGASLGSAGGGIMGAAAPSAYDAWHRAWQKALAEPAVGIAAPVAPYHGPGYSWGATPKGPALLPIAPHAALDPTEKAFLSALAVGEVGKAQGGYHTLYGGGRFASTDKFPDWPGKLGPQGWSHAAGREQFEYATWEEEKRRLGLTDFSARSQDLAGWDLASRTYRRRTGRDLERDLAAGGHGSQIASSLHSIWPSMNATFVSRLRQLERVANNSPTPGTMASAAVPLPAHKPAAPLHPAAIAAKTASVPTIHVSNRSGGNVVVSASMLP